MMWRGISRTIGVQFPSFFFLTTNDPDVVSSTGDVFGITQVLFFYRSCLTNIIYWTFVRNSVKIPYKGLAVLVLV